MDGKADLDSANLEESCYSLISGKEQLINRWFVISNIKAIMRKYDILMCVTHIM